MKDVSERGKVPIVESGSNFYLRTMFAKRKLEYSDSLIEKTKQILAENSKE